MVCLEETKIKKTNQEVAHSLGVGRYLGWGAVNALGAFGGIFVLWDTRVLQLLEMEEGTFTISCLFKHVENGVQWSFTGVYGVWAVPERDYGKS